MCDFTYQPMFGYPIGPWHRHFAWWPVDTIDQGWKWLTWVQRRRCQSKAFLPGPTVLWWQFKG